MNWLFSRIVLLACIAVSLVSLVIVALSYFSLAEARVFPLFIDSRSANHSTCFFYLFHVCSRITTMNKRIETESIVHASMFNRLIVFEDVSRVSEAICAIWTLTRMGKGEKEKENRHCQLVKHCSFRTVIVTFVSFPVGEKKNRKKEGQRRTGKVRA